MTKVEYIQKLNADVVRKLRLNKLASGKPFMINAKNLPPQQSYLEFPDSSIKLVSISPNQRAFTVIAVLSKEEATKQEKITILFNSIFNAFIIHHQRVKWGR